MVDRMIEDGCGSCLYVTKSTALSRRPSCSLCSCWVGTALLYVCDATRGMSAGTGPNFKNRTEQTRRELKGTEKHSPKTEGTKPN